jgi:hypothetical protein
MPQQVLIGTVHQEVVILSKDAFFSQAWDSLLPTAEGCIQLEHPAQYGLRPRLSSDGEHQLYGLTWTHQYRYLVGMPLSHQRQSLHLTRRRTWCTKILEAAEKRKPYGRTRAERRLD